MNQDGLEGEYSGIIKLFIILSKGIMKENYIEDYFNSVADSWDEEGLNFPINLDEFFSFLPLKEGMKCLDIGCGTGVISEYLYKRTKQKVIGIDISSQMIKIAKEKNKNTDVEFICQDLFDFKGKEFDALIMYNCFPHFLDPKKLSLKTSELLNPEGL